MLLRPLWLLALLLAVAGWRRCRQRPAGPAMQAYSLPARRAILALAGLLPVILALAGPALRQHSQTVSSPALTSLAAGSLKLHAGAGSPRDRRDLGAPAASGDAGGPTPGRHPSPRTSSCLPGDAYLAMPPPGIIRPSPAAAGPAPGHHALQGSAPRAGRGAGLRRRSPEASPARLLLVTRRPIPTQMEHNAPPSGPAWTTSSACRGTPPASTSCWPMRRSALLRPPPRAGNWQRLPTPAGPGTVLLAGSRPAQGKAAMAAGRAPACPRLPMSQTQTRCSPSIRPWLLIPCCPWRRWPASAPTGLLLMW